MDEEKSDLLTFLNRFSGKKLWQLGGAVLAPTIVNQILPDNKIATIASIPVGYLAGGDIYTNFVKDQVSSLESFIGD